MAPPSDLPLILLLVVAFGAAVFLAAAEASLLRISEIKARSLADGAGKSAKLLLSLVERLPQTLNTILLLALLSQIGAATITGMLAQRWFGNAGVTIATVVLTVILFIYSEAIPKTFAVRHSARTALFVATPIAILERVLRPLVSMLVWIADIQAPGKGIATTATATEEELRLIAAEAAEEGEITEEDLELIHRAFRFGDRRADDIMVPRPDIVAVEADLSPDEAMNVALRSGHRRLPVYRGSLENILGVVKLRELIAIRDEGSVSLADIAHPALTVPESKVVSSLLEDMQMQNNHLAVVVDEYGVTVGIVTVEDVAEELLGSISEDSDGSTFEHLGDGRWLVSGRVPIEDLAREMDIDLPDGEWNTVAGMMVGLAGEILTPGSEVNVGNHRFEVESVSGRRITRISISPAPDA